MGKTLKCIRAKSIKEGKVIAYNFIGSCWQKDPGDQVTTQEGENKKKIERTS